MKLLAIDTATELCSAALWLEGAAGVREARRGRGNAELILPMIDELLKEAGLELAQLDAIAFGRGPGAFTGVRLAVSLAQGLGWSVGLPLIPISNLRAVAARLLQSYPAQSRTLVCMDARMHEVYWGCFERRDGRICALGPESVSAPGSIRLPAAWSGAVAGGAGSGFAAYASQLASSVPGLGVIDPLALPHASDIAALAAADGLLDAISPEDAQPVYLRDDVARAPAAGAPSGPSSN